MTAAELRATIRKTIIKWLREPLEADEGPLNYDPDRLVNDIIWILWEAHRDV